MGLFAESVGTDSLIIREQMNLSFFGRAQVVVVGSLMTDHHSEEGIISLSRVALFVERREKDCFCPFDPYSYLSHRASTKSASFSILLNRKLSLRMHLRTTSTYLIGVSGRRMPPALVNGRWFHTVATSG